MINWKEFKKGLSATYPYLLSHHQPHERYRCYSITLYEKNIDICSRCVGIYPGILLGFVARIVGIPFFIAYLLLIVLPLPALTDWILTTFSEKKGVNAIRTTTGLMLGFGFGLGIAQVLIEGNNYPLVVGSIYGTIAFILIVVEQKFSKRLKTNYK